MNSQMIFDENRLDAEFFQPEYLMIDEVLKSQGAHVLERYLTDIRYGLNVPAEYVENGLRFIRALNLKEYGIEGEVLSIPLAPEQVGQDNLLQKGDLLIVRSGANVGDLGIVISGLEGVTFGSYVIRMRVDDINPHYLYVYLKTSLGRQQTTRLRSGAAQPNISIPNLNQVLVFAPSVDEQNEIQRLLLNSYEQRELSNEIYEEAEELLLDALGLDAVLNAEAEAQRTYTQPSSRAWSAGRLDAEYWEPQYTNLVDYFRTMPHTTLGELADFYNSATPRGADYLEEGIPFLRIQNVDKNRLVLEEVVFIDAETHNNLLERSQLQPSDVLITITGRIGTAAVVPESLPVANINQHIVRMRWSDKDINPYYLSVFLNSKGGRLQTEREAYGTTRTALPYYCLERIVVPKAPQEIQSRIETKIREGKAARDEAHNLLEKAKQQVENLIFDNRT